MWGTPRLLGWVVVATGASGRKSLLSSGGVGLCEGGAEGVAEVVTAGTRTLLFWRSRIIVVFLGHFNYHRDWCPARVLLSLIS